MSDQDFNLFSHFQKQFAAHANKELLCTDKGRSYRYADIERASAGIANSLADCGAVPGDRISAQIEKSPQALSLYLACLRAGYVYHPLNPALQAPELEFFLADAQPKVVVCDPSNEATLGPLARKAGIPNLVRLDTEAKGSAEFKTLRRGKDDLAALLYSSGTTGKPKGIMLTHGNLLCNALALVDTWGFSGDDRLLHALPIFHVHGLFVAINCVLLSGASMRWLPALDAAQAMEFLPECTVMMGVPTYYTRLLQSKDLTPDVCKRMRVFISGSAPLLAETFAEFEACTGHRILERYGMTETGMNASNPLHGVRKPGTVGLPLPGVEVRVANETGELQVRGPNVFAGYWNRPDKTTGEFTKDGFFNTGDQGRIDEDGYVSIIGRVKDMVITGGLNVYPREVELFMDELPGIKESAVIGVPHPDLGEGIVAVVVGQDGVEHDEDKLIQAARLNLANYKVPKRVIFVGELPRNAMAKVQKSALRETYQQLFS